MNIADLMIYWIGMRIDGIIGLRGFESKLFMGLANLLAADLKGMARRAILQAMDYAALFNLARSRFGSHKK